MNKKGFAISIILYSMVFLLVSIFYMLLGVFKTRYITSSNLREGIINELNSSNSLGDRVLRLCDKSKYVQKYNSSDEIVDGYSGTNDGDVCVYVDDNTTSLANKNGNVIFGDFCWKIVRTTANGGVKLLYNGPKTSDNKCPEEASERPSKNGFVGSNATTTTLSGSKMYGAGFTYYNNTFNLSDTFIADWATDSDRIIGTYTCNKSNSGACTTLYYVGAYKNDSTAYVVTYTIGEVNHYSEIGTSAFNAFTESLAEVSYMYNDTFFGSHRSCATNKEILPSYNISSTTAYYYGDKATWNPTTNKYDVTINGATPTTLTAWGDIRSNVKGLYTCKNSTDTSCETVYYIPENNSNGSVIYTIPLSNNESIDTKTVTWTYGNSYVENNGNYELKNTTTETFLLKDWYANRYKYRDKYVCYDFSSSSCSKLYYIYDVQAYYYGLNVTDYKYYFSNSVTYSDGKYTLNTDSDPSKYQLAWEYGKTGHMDKMHYTCFSSTSNECGDTVYYVFYISNAHFYLPLQNGETIETAVNKMINNSNSGTSTINKYSSAIKGILENWYRQNIEYQGLSEYIDSDAVFCNDRSVKEYNGMSPNGSPLNYIKFFGYSLTRSTAKLTCDNVTDQYSVNNNKASLNYPIGLLTYSEKLLLNRDYVKTGQKWWLMTPAISISTGSLSYTTATNEYETHTNGGTSLGVRPVIVLKNDVEITGTGSNDDPYIVYTTPAYAVE